MTNDLQARLDAGALGAVAMRDAAYASLFKHPGFIRTLGGQNFKAVKLEDAAEGIAALEQPTHTAQLAAALALPEIAAMVDAVLRLNAACDAMWNDHERLEKNPCSFGQKWQLKDTHMKAISEAQQALPPILAALEARHE